MGRPVLICKAWPYANGPLHLGHVAALLPADVLARFYRSLGDDVLFVSGTDCHGTPIMNSAQDEGRSPQEVVDFYHRQFTNHFLRLGFTHDLYSLTHRSEHFKVVQELLVLLNKNGYIVEREVPQLYCPSCRRFLVDRFVEGDCPKCGNSKARGDQCDACSSTYEATELKNPKCKYCGHAAQLSHSKHLHLDLPKLQPMLSQWVAQAKAGWRNNAQTTTDGWLTRGLAERAITRDIQWGIPLPAEFTGYDDKVIYVWFEAVIGYLSASILAKGGDFHAGGDWERWWLPNENPLHIYVHGKDNIPFHTVIFPSMLLGLEDDFVLPHQIISSEFLNLPGGRKFSKSNKDGSNLPEFLELVDKVPALTIDTLRFYLIAHGPEEHDTKFTWDDLVNVHNAELLNKWANLVNRVRSLVEKNFENKVPLVTDGHLSLYGDPVFALYQNTIEKTYDEIENLIRAGKLHEACLLWVKRVEYVNEFIALQAPWALVKTDKDKAADVLFVALQWINNLGRLIAPVIPFAYDRLQTILNTTTPFEWSPNYLPGGHELGAAAYLFQRIDRKELPSD